MSTEIPASETPLSKEQLAEMQRLKAYYPFRIVYGALSPSGEWQCGGVANKREPNRLARLGWQVFTI